ncbi:MAG: hypothetical protein WA081_08285 [Desulfosalsimonadaceae bacterium]
MFIVTMLICEYLPNNQSNSRFYEYNEELSTVGAIDRTSLNDPKIHGWLIRFKDITLKNNTLIIFGKENKIFIDFGNGPKNFSSKEISMNFRRYFNLLFLKYIDNKNFTKNKFVIFTPPWRYLFNDGMFPEDVEPIYAVARMLNIKSERVRLEKELTDGII